MTSELLNQINFKNDICNSRKINFKTFERNCQQKYRHYQNNSTTTHLIVSKSNIKKTWKTINDKLGKGRNQSKLPTYIVANEKKLPIMKK